MLLLLSSDSLVKPARLVRINAQPAKRSVLQPIQTKGAARVGLADPLTKPAIIVKGHPKPYRGVVTVVRGAARVGLADPLVRPVLIVRGLIPVTRFDRKQPIQTRGGRLTSATDPLTKPSLIVKGQPKPYRGNVTIVRGSARVGVDDPLTLPARVVTPIQPKHPDGQVTRTRGGALTSATDPRTRPALMVSGLVNRSRITWAPQPSNGKPARLGDTDNRQTVGALQIVSPQQPIAQRAERRQPFANRWWSHPLDQSAFYGTLTITQTDGVLAMTAAGGALTMTATGGTLAVTQTDGTLATTSTGGSLVTVGG